MTRSVEVLSHVASAWSQPALSWAISTQVRLPALSTSTNWAQSPYWTSNSSCSISSLLSPTVSLSYWLSLLYLNWDLSLNCLTTVWKIAVRLGSANRSWALQILDRLTFYSGSSCSRAHSAKLALETYSVTTVDRCTNINGTLNKFTVAAR